MPRKPKTPPAPPPSPESPRPNTTVLDDISMKVVLLEYDRRRERTVKALRGLAEDFTLAADRLSRGGLDAYLGMGGPNYHAVMRTLAEVEAIDAQQTLLRYVFGLPTAGAGSNLEDHPQVKAARVELPLKEGA